MIKFTDIVEVPGGDVCNESRDPDARGSSELFQPPTAALAVHPASPRVHAPLAVHAHAVSVPASSTYHSLNRKESLATL